MDPQACLQRWRDAAEEGDHEEAMFDLACWLKRGGFWPTGLTALETNALRNRMHGIAP